MSEFMIALSKEAIFTIILASTPAILASLIIGLAIALFSATTQIQEATLSFAPKMIAVYLAIIAFGAPVGVMILNFTKTCFLTIFKL